MHYLILQVQQQLEDGDSATSAVAAPGLTNMIVFLHYLILQVQQQLEDGGSATAAVAAPDLTTAPAYHHKQFLIIYA